MVTVVVPPHTIGAYIQLPIGSSKVYVLDGYSVVASCVIISVSQVVNVLETIEHDS